MFKAYLYCLCLILFLFFFSCRSSKVSEEKIDDFQGTCYEFLKDMDASQPVEFDIDDFDDDLQDKFSERALVIANALNLKSELRKLSEFDREEGERLDYFILYQEVINRIGLIDLEVSSLNAALRCDEDRTTQLALFLDRTESSITNRRTVAGILTDASANVVSGVIILWAANGSTFRQMLGVGASLAQIVLNISNKIQEFTVEVEHEINLIREIYEEQPEWSEVIPPSVWYYINEKRIGINDNTILEELVDSWDEFIVREDFDFYLADGGKYNVDQLRNRASMLDQLGSYVDLMKQDLLMLRREVLEFK